MLLYCLIPVCFLFLIFFSNSVWTNAQNYLQKVLIGIEKIVSSAIKLASLSN